MAMIGETSPEEMQDLRQHLNECAECRHEYQEFVQLVLPQLSASDESVPPVATHDDTQGRRARFLERAQAAGISFSSQALNPAEEPTEVPETVSTATPIGIPERQRAKFRLVYRGSIAAALLASAALGGYLAANRHREPIQSGAGNSAASSAPSATTDASNPATSSPNFSAMLAADSRTITALETRLNDANAQLTTAQTNAESAARERAELERQIDAQKQALTASQQQGETSTQAVSALQTQLSQLQTRADAAASSASLDQLKVNDLSGQVKELNASLERAHDMLSAGRDMRDMMAARNLHIVDVVDTDSKGKNQPAFGRIFFAENRQLVFYAYDLNEKRLEDARFDYRIWGQKEGQPHTARSLGVFYSDDKTQHRWVFKCEDPKTLAEIDSVFVTLEPSTTDPAHPKGPQLMYAYLRGQPNHP